MFTIIFQIVAYFYLQNNSELITIIGDISFVIVALCAAISGLNAYKSLKKCDPEESKGWAIATIAFGLFMLGDIYWAYSELILKINTPLGSIADLFWTLAYFALIIATLKLQKAIFYYSKLQKYIFTILGLIIGGYVAYNSLSAYFNLTHNIGNLANDLYVTYDFIILGIILSIILPLLKTKQYVFLKSWITIMLAILLRIFYDLLFAYLTELNTYQTGNYIDILYASSYVIFALANYLKTKTCCATND